MRKRTSRHHILPRSKGGSSEKNNILIVDGKKHEAYHLLFNNLLPEEAVMKLIEDWFYKDQKLRDRKLHKLTMELAKLCADYINQRQIKGFREGTSV